MRCNCLHITYYVKWRHIFLKQYEEAFIQGTPGLLKQDEMSKSFIIFIEMYFNLLQLQNFCNI